ncbi:hypothetical protein AMAG_18818 [Allomyces macrogynus ATCC 38327]|uniref:Uncharacterized protein n=1 Tax=Allomyces macrogynus (strain ATCC 38327) TaxID=578462 RepID=A0A0L0SI21_ALLM3|nr:hypothetical protein AMAG_18818 [Allomyces macrogynus ATCC 38327]|eukprot:KNE62168.1 hypothetical protein AMAG_18818 [Allomyces macrogynus ATCC 38327]
MPDIDAHAQTAPLKPYMLGSGPLHGSPQSATPALSTGSLANVAVADTRPRTPVAQALLRPHMARKPSPLNPNAVPAASASVPPLPAATTATAAAANMSPTLHATNLAVAGTGSVRLRTISPERLPAAALANVGEDPTPVEEEDTIEETIARPVATPPVTTTGRAAPTGTPSPTPARTHARSVSLEQRAILHHVHHLPEGTPGPANPSTTAAAASSPGFAPPPTPPGVLRTASSASLHSTSSSVSSYSSSSAATASAALSAMVASTPAGVAAAAQAAQAAQAAASHGSNASQSGSETDSPVRARGGATPFFGNVSPLVSPLMAAGTPAPTMHPHVETMPAIALSSPMSGARDVADLPRERSAFAPMVPGLGGAMCPGSGGGGGGTANASPAPSLPSSPALGHGALSAATGSDKHKLFISTTSSRRPSTVTPASSVGALSAMGSPTVGPPSIVGTPTTPSALMWAPSPPGSLPSTPQLPGPTHVPHARAMSCAPDSPMTLSPVRVGVGSGRGSTGDPPESPSRPPMRAVSANTAEPVMPSSAAAGSLGGAPARSRHMSAYEATPDATAAYAALTTSRHAVVPLTPAHFRPRSQSLSTSALSSPTFSAIGADASPTTIPAGLGGPESPTMVPLGAPVSPQWRTHRPHQP